jgi:riboflavin synthase
MFTGLIEATGRIEAIETTPHGGRLRVSAPLAAELREGDSIAVSGVCLTAIAPDAQSFGADLGPETLRATTIGSLTRGQIVNLERPLRADARLGGHFVLGHVDGTGSIRDVRPDGDSYWFDVDLPAPLHSLVISKGSIAIDGISLTVAALTPAGVSVQIIPYTFAHTSLGSTRAGDAVNIEVDVLGKYVARLLASGETSASREAMPLRP